MSQDILEFLKQLDEPLDDKSIYRVNDSANKSEIRDLRTNKKILVVGSKPRTLMGRRPVLTLMDEPSSFDPGTADAIIAAVKTASGKNRDARVIFLGTAPLAGSGHFFETELNKESAIVYKADKDDDPFKVSTWHKANPSMRYIPALRAAIEEEAETAKADPAAYASFLALRLNMGGSGVATDTLLAPGTWETVEKSTGARTGDTVVAVDLAQTQMAGVACVWDTGAVDAFACFPETPLLEERGRRDNVGMLYKNMERRGELLTLGRLAVDIPALMSEIVRRWGVPNVLVVDRYRLVELKQALHDVNFPPVPLIVRGMGYIDGSGRCAGTT